jgi:hypothetical protein
MILVVSRNDIPVVWPFNKGVSLQCIIAVQRHAVDPVSFSVPNTNYKMCFSASASFGLSAVLVTTSAITFRKVKSKDQLMFAAIPLVFAIQQFTEGFVWLSLKSGGDAGEHNIPAHIFLFFAHVVWPLWVPVAVFVMEKNPARKKIVMAMILIGAVVSVYLGSCLLRFPVHASIRGHHVFYGLDFPLVLKWFCAVLYFIPTVLPPFVSSGKRMKLLGLAVLASYIVSQVFFEGYVISVWCFFAAAISATVYFIIHGFSKVSTSDISN